MSRRDRRRPNGRSRRKAMAIAVGVLAIVVLVAVLLLTQLDPGRGAKRAVDPASSSSTSSTTQAPTTTTSALRQAVQYMVQQGDTLSAIARRFHVTTAAIIAANKALTSPDKLTVGQALTIPPEVPVKLLVKPATVSPGATANLALSGAQPGERVTFEIQTPTGTFKGPVHVAGPDGTVNTTYAPNATDPAGSYQVVAHGDQGTNAIAALVVGAPGAP